MHNLCRLAMDGTSSIVYACFLELLWLLIVS